MSLQYCYKHDVMVDTDYDAEHFLAEAEEGIEQVEENNEELAAIQEGSEAEQNEKDFRKLVETFVEDGGYPLRTAKEMAAEIVHDRNYR